MRIVHMTSVHRWDDNRIFNKMCRSLASAGHDIHLVAAMEGEQDGSVVDGVNLHRVKYPTNRGERFLKTTPTVLSRALALCGDLYHFHDPEFLPYIVRYRSWIRRPVIYDAHEDYPAAVLSKDWLIKPCRPLISMVVDLFERRSVMRVDGLVVSWPKIMKRFLEHPKRALINNYPYKDELKNSDGPQEERHSGCFVYVGVLSRKRGLLEMIKATGIGGKGYRLLLGGDWSPEDFEQECQAERGWEHCEYKGYLGRKGMRELFGIAQAGLIAFHPEPNHLYSIPNKIFEYMSAGLPVIASDLPMQRSIVEETGCGVIADAKSPDAIFSKMKWIREHPDEARKMGIAGRRAVEEKFNWESEVKKLMAFYGEVCAAF